MISPQEMEAATKDMIKNSIFPAQVNKSCSFCHTTSTPLWRVGPSGPKSLCNACGIKYNKKRRALMGLGRGSTREDVCTKEKRRAKGAKMDRKKMGSCSRKARQSLKMRLMALEMEMLLRRSEKQRNKLGEEEWAAILLMALSMGCVNNA